MKQEPLFVPGSHREEPAIQARLLSRATDPISSKLAAPRATRQLRGECGFLLEMVKANPRRTTLELAVITGNPAKWRFVFAKRMSVLKRRNKVRSMGFRTCSVSGEIAEVWEATP